MSNKSKVREYSDQKWKAKQHQIQIVYKIEVYSEWEGMH